MNSKDIGDISETAVIHHMKKKENTISIPFGDNSRYDIIIDDGEELKRVQVKTGRLDDGVIKFNTRSSYGLSNNSTSDEYTEEEIDLFMVYCPSNENIYKVPVCETGSREMWLRVDKPENQSKTINWAEEYEI